MNDVNGLTVRWGGGAGAVGIGLPVPEHTLPSGPQPGRTSTLALEAQSAYQSADLRGPFTPK